MTTALVIVTIGCAAWVTYTFGGYPLLVWGLASLRTRSVPTGKALPRVVLIVSAFNEDAVIERKLENSLALDYPPHLLDIWVSSDGSTDMTNEIVRRFETQGRVHLVAHPENTGKTATLTQTLRLLPDETEVVVFSDANGMYEDDAVRRLVRHFADPAVGAVAGELTYGESGPEGTFRRYENWIKKSESRLGTCLVAEGSIFAARRELIPDLGADQVEDIAIPLAVALRGLRVVYEHSARSSESFRLNWRRQFRRRRRIVNRCVWTLVAFRSALNPFRHPRVAFMLFSHRVMRWLAPLVMLVGALAAIALFLEVVDPRPLTLVVLVAALGSVAGLASRQRHGRRVLLLAMGFLVASAAILAGLGSAVRGSHVRTWTPVRD